MAADRTPAKTDEERLARYLAYHRRYDQSPKGKARKKRYRDSLRRAKESAAAEKGTLEKFADFIED